MNRTSAPTRLISVVLAAVLTSTLVPSASIAFASDAVSDEHANEEAIVEQTVEEAASDEAPAITSAELPVSTSASAPEEQSASDVEIVSGNMRLDGEATTILTYAGMSFQVNADEPDTVSLVGIDSSAEGAFELPQTIALANKTYTLSRIMAGGGSLI